MAPSWSPPACRAVAAVERHGRMAGVRAPRNSDHDPAGVEGVIGGCRRVVVGDAEAGPGMADERLGDGVAPRPFGVGES